MASITKRTTKENTETWLVQIRIKGHKTINKTFLTYDEALKYANKEELRVRKNVANRGKADTKAFMNAKFVDVIELYRKEVDSTSKHAMQLRTIVKHLGEVTIGEVNKKFLKSYISKMLTETTHIKTTFKAGTIARHFSAMTKVYKWYADEMEVELVTLPFKTALLPRGWNVKRERRLSRDEEKRLRARMHQAKHGFVWQMLLTFAIETAARLQEMLYAKWDEVDFDVGVWRIPAQHCKSRKTRSVPISHKAMACLKILKAHASAEDNRIFHWFKTKDGCAGTFKYFTETIGLVDFRFHDLRHEGISRMVLFRRQLSIYEIMKIVGHSSLDMLNRYANLRGEELVERFNAKPKI